MWERIKQFSQPPVFSNDQAKTRQARMLNDILIVNMLAVLAAFAIALVTSAPPIVPIILALYELVLLGLKIWITRGDVTPACYALVLLFFAGVTAIDAAFGTVFSPVSGYYILAIVITGLLLDSRAMIGIGALEHPGSSRLGLILEKGMAAACQY